MIRGAVSGSGQRGTLVVETVEAQEDMEVAGVVEPMEEDGEFVAASGTSYPRHADPAADRPEEVDAIARGASDLGAQAVV